MSLNKQVANYKVPGKDISVSLETSPQRHRAVKSWYDARDCIQAANPDYRFAMCNRELQIWDGTGIVKLGGLDEESDEWLWP